MCSRAPRWSAWDDRADRTTRTAPRPGWRSTPSPPRRIAAPPRALRRRPGASANLHRDVPRRWSSECTYPHTPVCMRTGVEQAVPPVPRYTGGSEPPGSASPLSRPGLAPVPPPIPDHCPVRRAHAEALTLQVRAAFSFVWSGSGRIVDLPRRLTAAAALVFVAGSAGAGGVAGDGLVGLLCNKP
jgi:hypothetical protein